MKMSKFLPRSALPLCVAAFLGLVSLPFAVGTQALAQDDSNACPVDGCIISISEVEKAGEELKVVFEANFTPDMSKNHIHIWWGENFTVEQVSNNAETVHGVVQGAWHPTDEYPEYITQSAVSLTERGEATSLCVSAANRDHDILDIALFECESVVELLQ